MLNILARSKSFKSKTNKKPIVLGLAIAYVMFASFIFLACERGLHEDPLHAIGGVVRDAETNMPIHNAWVDNTDSIPPYSLFSDSIGHYVFAYLGTAKHEVHIYCGKEDYLTFDSIVTIPTNALLKDTVDIYLSHE